jgi:hypothetical protein
MPFGGLDGTIRDAENVGWMGQASEFCMTAFIIHGLWLGVDAGCAALASALKPQP